MSASTNVVKRTSSVFRKLAFVYDAAEVYRQTASRYNKHFMDLLNKNLEIARKSELVRKIDIAKGYYRVEISPPTSAEEMCKLRTDIDLFTKFMQSGCYKYLTVKQAWLLFLVGTEIVLWFFLGETIGKMHIVGYKV